MVKNNESSIYIFLPQSEPHSFFYIWCLTLVLHLQKTSDKNLILATIEHSNVESNFSHISTLSSISFNKFKLDKLKSSDTLCVHVHDEFFQRWFLKNQGMFPSSLSIMFYTDGSNPYIHRRHLEYFSKTNLKFSTIDYINFPASKYCYFWWTNSEKSRSIRFQNIGQSLVLSSYKKLKSLYAGDAYHIKTNPENSNTNLTLVVLRPFLETSCSANSIAKYIAEYIQSKVKGKTSIIIKADNRVSDCLALKINQILTKSHYSVTLLDSRFNSIPIEFLLGIQNISNFDKLDVLAFDGSVVFNYFLLRSFCKKLTIHCEIPKIIWEYIDKNSKKSLRSKHMMAKIILSRDEKVNLDYRESNLGSIFNL